MTAASFRRVPRGYRPPPRKIYRESPFGGSQPASEPSPYGARTFRKRKKSARAAIFIRSFTAVHEEPPLDVIDRLTFAQFQPLSSYSTLHPILLPYSHPWSDLTEPPEPKVIMQYQDAGSFRRYFSLLPNDYSLARAPAVTIIYEDHVPSIRRRATSRAR